MSLEKRVRRLETREELKELRYRYCYAVDEGDWETFHELFTDDAVLDFGGLGTYEGREGLDRFAEEFVETTLDGSSHMVTNPILDVDVENGTATGTWYVESPITIRDGHGGYRQGRYDDEYRRVDGDWKFASFEMRFHYTSDYDAEKGWEDIARK